MLGYTLAVAAKRARGAAGVSWPLHQCGWDGLGCRPSGGGLPSLLSENRGTGSGPLTELTPTLAGSDSPMGQMFIQTIGGGNDC